MTRNYLGASSWSHCDRKMWLKYRQAFDAVYTPEQLRTFGIGHACEDVMVDDLEARGIVVSHREAELMGKYGQPVGHIDGVVTHKDGRKQLLEMKTANDRRFKDMMKKGLPDYYRAQVQIYMHHSDQLDGIGEKINETHYCILSKNTSELFEFEVERVEIDGEIETERMHNVIESEDMPPKCESWMCKMCEFNTFCEFGDIPNISCRTCANVSVVDGEFRCPHGTEACDSHLIHPAFMLALGHEIISADSKNLAIEYGQCAHGPVGYKHPTKETFTSVEYKQYFEEQDHESS